MNLTDEQVVSEYSQFLTADTCKWAKGLGLLFALSGRFGGLVKKELYVEGVKKVFAIKPSIAGREEMFFDPHFIIPLDEVKKLGVEATEDMSIGMLEDVNVPSFGMNGTLRYKTPMIDTLEQFSEQVYELLGKRKGILRHGERFLTFGSCFAVNVGRALREQGCSVYTLLVTEDINSTFNNLTLLQRIFLNMPSRLARELGSIKDMDFDVIKAEFQKATDIVFTLGNIYHFENNGEATIVDHSNYDLEIETIGETLSHLRSIFDILTQFTTARILVSVSPIPISGYCGSAFSTAIEADCVSKSQLRAALNEVLKEFRDIIYMPTFEIFKWLPPHQSFATFGTEDGHCRHLSQAHLAKVMEAIC